MVKVKIIDDKGKKSTEFDFKINADIREDVFKKAVLTERSVFKQPYGAKPDAGKKQVISLSKRRKKFRSTYGKGGSRTPKKIMWRRGMQLRMVGAFAPNTIGGRKAHAPKASKNIIKSMNKKEWLMALKVGFIASLDKNLIEKNGQKVSKEYPFILDDSFNKANKTKDILKTFENLDFSNELSRVSKKSIRAGVGKNRNRKYKLKRGPLFVYSDVDESFLKAIKNIFGFDLINVDELLVSDFGMSEKPGRQVVFTKNSANKFMEIFN